MVSCRWCSVGSGPGLDPVPLAVPPVILPAAHRVTLTGAHDFTVTLLSSHSC